MGKGATRVEELSGNGNVGEEQRRGNRGRETGCMWQRSECDEILQQKPLQGSEE